jgi:hypothetical protein
VRGVLEDSEVWELIDKLFGVIGSSCAVEDEALIFG